MLCMQLSVGESVLFQGKFELRLERYQSGKPCFSLSVAKRSPFTIMRAGSDSVTGGNCYPGSPEELVATYQSRIRVGDCVVVIHRLRNDRVKLSIDAPREVKISRPAQHGGTLQAV